MSKESILDVLKFESDRPPIMDSETTGHFDCEQCGRRVEVRNVEEEEDSHPQNKGKKLWSYSSEYFMIEADCCGRYVCAGGDDDEGCQRVYLYHELPENARKVLKKTDKDLKDTDGETYWCSDCASKYGLPD